MLYSAYKGENIMVFWSKMHLITLLPTMIIMIGVSILISYLLRKKSQKIKIIPLQVLSAIAIGLEIAKQIIGIVDGYDTYWLPFHFSSIFLFSSVVVCFFTYNKTNWFARFSNSYFSTYLTMMFVFMAVYPEIIYSGETITNFSANFLNAHTIIYHNIVVFAFFLMIGLNFYEKKTKFGLMSAVLGSFSYGIVGGTMATILKTNYNSFYFCQVAPIEQIRQSLVNSLGFGGQIIYVMMILAATIFFSIVCYGVFRLIVWLKELIFKQKNQLISQKEVSDNQPVDTNAQTDQK